MINQTPGKPEGWNFPTIPQLQQHNFWNLRMDKYFLTHFMDCG